MKTTSRFKILPKRSSQTAHFGRLIRLFLFLMMSCMALGTHAQDDGDEVVYTGATLDSVQIKSAEEARALVKRLFDIKSLTINLGIRKIAQDPRIIKFTSAFQERNNIDVLAVSYTEGDGLWETIFRSVAKRKYERAYGELIKARMVFKRLGSDSSEGYEVNLEIEGGNSQVYNLFHISDTLVQRIAAKESVKQSLEGGVFSEPKKAQDQVVQALIASLMRIEGDTVNGVEIDSTDQVPEVQFLPSPQMTYGFDRFRYNQLSGDYLPALINESSQRVPWKSMRAFDTDVVEVTYESGVEPTFVLGGVPLNVSPVEEANHYSLAFQGGTGGAVSELMAVTSGDDRTLMGQLNVVTYEEINTEVKIVPINGAGGNFNLLAIASALNDIYRPAVVQWNVEVEPNLEIGYAWDENSDRLLDVGSSGLLSNYTSEMNQLIREYKRARNRDKRAYYIFLVDGANSGTKLGYMPRKKQWGFVITGNHNNQLDLEKTIAHELGHGAFRLEHPFSERGLPRGQTDNLMDYSRGTTLFKYQWDFTHDPASVGLFEEDEDGALEDEEAALRRTFKNHLITTYGAEIEEQSCFIRSWNRGGDIYARFEDFNIATFAFFD